MHNKTKPKIVFLGSDFSPISLGCLKALAMAGRYELLVGIERYDKSRWQLVNTTWRRHGLRGVLSRIVRLSIASAQVRLQSVNDVKDGRCLSEVAKLAGMGIFRCSQVNGPDVQQIIKTFDPDLIVVANFSQLIRSRVRAIPRLGIINFHPSLLPKYRGPMPCFWIVKNRETRSGISVHFVDDGIDTGDILLQQEFPVLPHATETSLIKRSVEVGTPLLVRAVESIITGIARRRVPG